MGFYQVTTWYSLLFSAPKHKARLNEDRLFVLYGYFSMSWPVGGALKPLGSDSVRSSCPLEVLKRQHGDPSCITHY